MPSILVIDDEPLTGQFISTVLEDENFEVTTASSGREGISLARARRFDLAITDVYMPETDGMETIMALHEICPDIKIIAMSGGGLPGDVLSFATALGADKALSKPFTGSQVIAAVKEVLGID